MVWYYVLNFQGVNFMCYFRFFTFSLVIEAAWSYVCLIITVCEFYVGLISIYVIYLFFSLLFLSKLKYQLT